MSEDGLRLEYRVAHCFNIGDLTYGATEREQFNDLEANYYFGRAEVLPTRELALDCAHTIARDIEPLEYGVSLLSFPTRKFQKLTPLEIKQMERRRAEDSEIRREENNKRIAAAIAARTFELPPDAIVEVKSILVGYVFPDGTERTGHLEGLDCIVTPTRTKLICFP